MNKVFHTSEVPQKVQVSRRKMVEVKPLSPKVMKRFVKWSLN